MKAFWLSLCAVVVFTMIAPMVQAGDELVIYCGRKQKYVEPVIKAYEKETGIKVTVRYAKTPVLAAQLKEEGDKSPADLFWAQDVSALGSLSKSGMLAKLPDSAYATINDQWKDSQKFWVATSGRARVLAYNPKLVKEADLPTTIWELTDPKWKGKIGWAPTNGSFKAFVTAMRLKFGDEKTLEWLKGIKANNAKVYPKNTPIIQGLAAEEVAIGLPNHYYLLRFKADDANYPVEQKFFKDGDIGNLMFVAGLGMLKNSDHKAAAEKFIKFATSNKAQSFFTNQIFEYPVGNDVKPNPRLVGQEIIKAAKPDVNIEAINDLDGTTELLKQAGLL